MFGRIKLYVAAGLAFALGLLGIYWRGKSAGVEAERNKHMRRRIDAMTTAKDVRDEVESDPDLVRRATEWVRTNDKR